MPSSSPPGALCVGYSSTAWTCRRASRREASPPRPWSGVKDLAILPNRVRADVRECFIIVSGYGDLASERAYLRGETFTCVRADGGVIEVPSGVLCRRRGWQGRHPWPRRQQAGRDARQGIASRVSASVCGDVQPSAGDSGIQYQQFKQQQPAAVSIDVLRASRSIGCRTWRGQRHGPPSELLYGLGRADLPRTGGRCWPGCGNHPERGNVFEVGGFLERGASAT